MPVILQYSPRVNSVASTRTPATASARAPEARSPPWTITKSISDPDAAKLSANDPPIRTKLISRPRRLDSSKTADSAVCTNSVSLIIVLLFKISSRLSFNHHGFVYCTPLDSLYSGGFTGHVVNGIIPEKPGRLRCPFSGHIQEPLENLFSMFPVHLFGIEIFARQIVIHP